MKDHALKMIEDFSDGMTFLASDAVWVLTVPAIWNVAAKQFMREAAIEVSEITQQSEKCACTVITVITVTRYSFLCFTKL